MPALLRGWVRLRRERLDRDLAAGSAPTTAPLRLRAHQLTSPGARRALAELAEAIRREDAQGELAALAARLRAPQPVSATGAACARLLLQAPDHGPGPLWERAWNATDALDDDAR